MKNFELKKMTAFAAALALAAQSSMEMISAEETESETAAQTVTEEGDTVTAEVPAEEDPVSDIIVSKDSEDPMARWMYSSYLDVDKDGILSDEELSKATIIEFNGKDFSEPITSLDVLKKTSVSSIILKNMRDFDLALLKELKGLKQLEFNGMVTVKNIEVLGELDLDYIEVNAIANDNEPFVKPVDIYPYIKCMDITVKKGELKSFTTSPECHLGNDYKNRLFFECEDKNVALLASGSKSGDSSFAPKVSDSVTETGSWVYGYEEGETTYTCKAADGTVISKAKITVVADDEISDPALIKSEVKPVKVMNEESYEAAPMAYVLYDNGSLYTFKDGALKEYQQNIKDAVVHKSDIYALSEDGVLYINGNAVNEKSEYTIVSAGIYLDSLLCSDGCVRIISDTGKAKKILENIKAMDENFGHNLRMSGIVLDEEDVTSIIYRNIDGEYVKYPLEEKFEPIRISSKNPTLTGGINYVYTADKKIYEISAYFPRTNVPGFDTLSETEVSVTVNLFDENVEKMSGSEYITSDGKTHSIYGGASDYDEDNILLYKMRNLGNIDLKWCDLSDSKGNKVSRVTHYTITPYSNGPLFSIRDNDGTERYDFVRNAKPLTHVKLNYGIYKDGSNRCVLIQREDDTLWKYVIETGELVRLDEAITGSEVLTSAEPATNETNAPEPEKTEPKEKESSENENKEPEVKEITPETKNVSGKITGDISDDGRVDVTDLTMISLALLGDLNLTDAQSQAADVNHDGKVDLADLATMRQFLSKKISSLA
ncbi:MAG: dockerin type I repeat-containing protein [Oscillospiraceae bacterium]|nr:dockerin type I repeat-containing protein [Oscillospiraceae bacterium]